MRHDVPRVYKFVAQWPKTGISRLDTCRRKLNVVINLYNEWQRDLDFEPASAIKVLAYIEEGKQTFAAADNQASHLEELEAMASFVRERLAAYDAEL